jgi:antirestriction protein ArdC
MKLSKKAQASMQKVLDKFKNGDLSPVTRVARIKLDDSSPAVNWSLSNRVLAYVQSGELDCRGYRQWEQVGRTVKKGEQAVYILRPIMIKAKKDNSDELEVHFTCIGFSTIPVFAASSTEGSGELTGYDPIEYPPLHEVARKMGIQVEYAPIAEHKLGDCLADGSKIRLATHDERIFFHELAHAIHARIDGELKGGQHASQETVAEFTSVVLMDLYGYADTTGNAWNYISQYADDPLLAITKAIGTVEKIVATLLEEGKKC